MNHELALELLEGLLDTMEEGERGFALATRDNREPGVVDVLKEGEESCREAVIELQDQVRMLGAPSEGSRSAKRPVYRGWISFKAVPITRDTKLILEECERGEDYAKARYEDAMNVDLPESLRVMMEHQYQRVIAIQGRVRLLRNRYRSTEVPRAIGDRPSSR